ncbi:MAG: hypothetical protein AAGA55_00820 [Planctomycetota bacterium]
MIRELSRSSASRLTLATQAVSAVLLLGTGAVFMIGLPDRERPAATTPVANIPPQNESEPDAGASDGSSVGERVDMGGLAARLSMLDNAPVLPAVETRTDPDTDDEGGDDGGDDGVPPQPFASRVRYLGLIRVGDASMAFVNIDGTQRVVREGSVVQPMQQRPELGALNIRTITATSITVSHEDGEAKIELSERSGPAVTLVAGGEIDRIEAAVPGGVDPGLGQFETNANGTRLPAAEIERRRRALERQRTQDPRDYEGPGLRMPERNVIGSMGNSRGNRDRNRRQREQNTGGDE